jgi:HAD superfamily hydrolase (TIGR01490 family)
LNLAIFDLDGTLLAGDSDHQWGQFLIEEGLLDRDTHTELNDRFYQDYKDGKLDIMVFLTYQLKPLASHPRRQLNALHQRFMERKVRPMMTAKGRALVEKHREAGDLLVVLTATNSFVTAPIAREYGVENLIATDPEQLNGEFTGRVSGTPCFQQGKVNRLLEWLEARGQSLQSFRESWFYSDSHNDLPLMKLVSRPVAVDADPQLTEYAKANGWPLVSLR